MHIRVHAVAASVTALVTAATVSAAARTTALVGRQARAAPVFTAQQALDGKAAYAKSCASCHMPDLSGSNEIPALKGTTFMATWGARSTKELFDYMSAAMPYGAPPLTTDTYASIEAYILQSNGASAGPAALTATTAASIGALSPIRGTPSD